MDQRAGPRNRITTVQALRAFERAIKERAFGRAQIMASRLLKSGVIDLSALVNLAEHLFGTGEIASADRFARIAAVIEPSRLRAYLMVLRGAEERETKGAHRVGGWAFVCDPSNPEAPGRASSLARRDRDAGAAIIHYRRSLELRPWSAATWFGAGIQIRDLGNEKESFDAFRRATCLAPGGANALFALAEAAEEQLNHPMTSKRYGRVLIVDPGHYVAHQNHGHALRRQGRFVFAVNALHRSLLLEPAQTNVYVALGQVALVDREIPLVSHYFNLARTVGPRSAEAQFFGALTDLRVGKFNDGWERYFWFQELGFPRLARAQRLPRWPDEEAKPSGILVWNDQFGIGEEVMYLGAMSQLAKRVDRLVISCTPKLEPLVQRSFPGIGVTSPNQVATDDPKLGDRPSEVPLIAAISSMRRDFSDFPHHQGYLVADPERVAMLRERYRAPSAIPLIGISWSSPLGFQGPRKSMPLAEWGPIFQSVKARYVSLQYHADMDEIANARACHGVDIVVDPELNTFEDLDGHAAQIAAMDRVISISSIAAHLAGALGKPVDMIYPSEIALLWYWFHARADSPWYPSMTIHRPAPGEDSEALMTGLALRLREKIEVGARPR